MARLCIIHPAKGTLFSEPRGGALALSGLNGTLFKFYLKEFAVVNSFAAL